MLLTGLEVVRDDGVQGEGEIPLLFGADLSPFLALPLMDALTAAYINLEPTGRQWYRAHPA